MKRTTQFIGLTLVVTLLALCAGKQLSISNGAQAKIKANQLDYYIGNPKKAIVPGEGKSEFFLVDETTGKIVFTGTLPEGKLFEPAGEVVAIADFSSFEQPGTYRLADGRGGAGPRSRRWRVRPTCWRFSISWRWRRSATWCRSPASTAPSWSRA